MNKNLVAAFAFVGVFLCGGIAGGLISVRLAHRAVQSKAVEQVSLQQWRRLAEQLQLTPEQREKIRPIIGRSMQELQGARVQLVSITERMEQDVQTVLTEEQRTKYREIRSRQADDDRLWQRMLREQRARRGGQLPMLAPGMERPPLGPNGERPPLGPNGERPQRPMQGNRPAGER